MNLTNSFGGGVNDDDVNVSDVVLVASGGAGDCSDSERIKRRAGNVQSYERRLSGPTCVYATCGFDTQLEKGFLASRAFEAFRGWNRRRRVSSYYRHHPRYRSQANLVYPVSLPIPLYLSTSLISSEHNKRAFSCFFSQLVDKRNDDDDRRPCAGIKLWEVT